MSILNKHRIRLFITLGVILSIGFMISLNNLRPVSERKKQNLEHISSEKMIKETQNHINKLNIKIAKNKNDYHLYYKRALAYKTINQFDNAIQDYQLIIDSSSNNELKDKAIKDMELINQIKNYSKK